MSDEQISLPYFVGIMIFAGLLIRYLFFSSPTQARTPVRNAEAIQRSRELAVERIQQMFPQAERRSVLWDLQRNGGNIQNTTERILTGRLDTPPVTFQPPPPPGQSSSATNFTSRQTASKTTQPDLITRYNLKDRLNVAAEQETQSKGWSSNRDERQAALQRRRDEMVLAARRKMEAKIASESVEKHGI